MSIPTRWVMVDDTDPGIKYTGPWNLTLDTQDDVGNNGPLFNGTSHVVNVNGNRADFSFAGSRLIIYGTSKAQLIDATTGVIDPSWDCFVDGVGLNSNPPTFTLENNWILCEIDSLSDGPHTVGVTARVSSPSNPFWLDRYQYVPSASVPLDNATIFVNSTDAAVQFGSGWTPLRDGGSMTQQNGAKVAFDFVGVQLSWVSTIPNTTGTQPTPATYSIDGGAPVTFQLAGLKDTSTEKTNQIFFQTPALMPGKHHIEVVHGGNISTTPLSLVYIVVKNGTVPASSSAGGSPGLPSNTASPNSGSGPHSTTKSKIPTGAIAGGVVGGILAIVALILLILFFQRRAKKRAAIAIEGHSTLDLAARQPTIEPFNAFPSAPVAYQLPSSSSSPFAPSYPIQTSGKGAKATLTPQRYAPPPPPSGTHSSGLGSGASETKGRDGAVVSAPSEGQISSQSGSSSGPAPLPVRVLRHEDSGVRLPEREEETVLELPPLYTPG